MLTLTERVPNRASAPSVALVALAVAAVLATALSGLVIGCLLVVAGLATAAAIIDARTGRLPDELLLAATFPLVALVVAAAFETGDLVAPALAMGAGAAAFSGPVFLIHLVSPAAMGFGDVKLAAVLGFALGVIDWRLSVLALCLASGGTALVGLARRRTTLPFGPGLVAGALVVAVASMLSEGLPTWP
jgi:leader peptidase (prepilin peptidase)/N-methyltransferase